MVAPPGIGMDGDPMMGGLGGPCAPISVGDQNLPPGTVTSTELATLPPPPFALENIQADAPPAKKRRLRGLEDSGLAKLLSGLHSCLERMVEPLRKEAPTELEAPVEDLLEEFERHWRLQFDARAMGEPSAAAFFRRFPDVFKIRTIGVHTMVAPVAAPDFQEAAEAGLVRDVPEREGHTADYASGSGELIAALLANLVSEERKATGAPLPFQFAHFEVVHDLLARLRDSAHEGPGALLGTLLDPKPPAPKKEPPPPPREPERRDDRHGLDDFPRGPPPGFDDRDRGPRGGGPPPRGDRRGGDGRSICRQFQSGHCTYGDTCRFVHELPDGRRVN